MLQMLSQQLMYRISGILGFFWFVSSLIVAAAVAVAAADADAAAAAAAAAAVAQGSKS